MNREIGYYWVCKDSWWEVAFFYEGVWSMTNGVKDLTDDAFSEIDERKLRRKIKPKKQHYTQRQYKN